VSCCPTCGSGVPEVRGREPLSWWPESYYLTRWNLDETGWTCADSFHTDVDETREEWR
jgi:hypothetical protein